MRAEDRAAVVTLVEVVVGLAALWLINRVGEAIDAAQAEDDMDFMLLSCDGADPVGLEEASP